ncbi:hypothetical protein TKK_0009403 [Trichogramma kaykai]|uniref:Uncharacterized protein n=1 Tax=Trichogramma kaykai TaxID=54128 RepID=A0ABD2WZ59_9HYME
MSSESHRKSVELSENLCTLTINKLDDTGSSDGEGDDDLDKLDNNASTSFFTSSNKKIVLTTKKCCASNETPRQNNAATASNKKKKNSTQSRVIYASDCMVSSLVVGPMVVAHWRGIWVLMDFHENIFSGWLCFGFGMSLHLLFALLKQPLHRAFSDDSASRSSDRRWTCRTIGCRLVRTAYTYVFSLACNCHWRGAWIILNDWFGLQAR